LGIKIVVTGDDLRKDKKRSLIILNHRTRLDWMFIWMLQNRFQILEQLKIVLKAQLKHIPGLGTFFFLFLFTNQILFIIGWGIQHCGFIFLDRAWEKDQQKIKNMIGYYKSSQRPVSVCRVFFIYHRHLTPYAYAYNNHTFKINHLT
jgi:lysocardiolipin and lysophospholipid acyltransferase